MSSHARFWARALGALAAVLALAALGGCPFDGAHGATSCDACDPGTSYCSVPGSRDPDGGCQYGAHCVPSPAACGAAMSCACLEDAEAAQYLKAGWSANEVQFDCRGSASAGFTVASTVEHCLAP